MTNVSRIGAATDLPSSSSQTSKEHVVQKGDTLWGIARQHGVSLAELEAANPRLAKNDFIFPGDRIALPGGGTPAHHVVGAGETLGGIAERYGVSTRSLVEANHLRHPDLIHPGQQLVINGHGHAQPATASTKAHGATTPTAAGTAAAKGGVPVPDATSVKAADVAAERAEGRRSEGKCYAYVKTALQKAGAVPDYIPGVAAKGAGPALEQRGFVNLLDRPGNGIKSPYDAPKGAVLVYGAAPGANDKNAKYGHIEIRTDKGFASDYQSARARTGDAANGLEGRGRTLIGVYVKPAAGSGTAPVASGSQSAPQSGDRIGNLSMKYETGYRPGNEAAAAATVSSGVGDPGGKSYGAYQFSSSASSGATVKTFLAHEGAPWAARFAGLDPTQPGGFEKAWKTAAAEQPAAFFEAQHNFIERTHYQPVADKAAAAGLDLKTQPQAVRDAVWSMAVQHHGAPGIVATALASLPAGGKSPPADLINALYDARSDYVRGVKMPAETRQSLLDRYVSERADALAMLK